MILCKFKKIQVVFTEGCSGTSFPDIVAETLGIFGFLRVFGILHLLRAFFVFIEIPKKLRCFRNVAFTKGFLGTSIPDIVAKNLRCLNSRVVFGNLALTEFL